MKKVIYSLGSILTLSSIIPFAISCNGSNQKNITSIKEALKQAEESKKFYIYKTLILEDEMKNSTSKIKEMNKNSINQAVLERMGFEEIKRIYEKIKKDGMSFNSTKEQDETLNAEEKKLFEKIEIETIDLAKLEKIDSKKEILDKILKFYKDVEARATKLANKIHDLKNEIKKLESEVIELKSRIEKAAKQANKAADEIDESKIAIEIVKKGVINFDNIKKIVNATWDTLKNKFTKSSTNEQLFNMLYKKEGIKDWIENNGNFELKLESEKNKAAEGFLKIKIVGKEGSSEERMELEIQKPESKT